MDFDSDEPLKGVAFLFPGQGSQAVGMADSFLANDPDAEMLGDLAADVLDFDLVDVIRSGPEEKLKETAITQPALLLTSILAFRALGLSPQVAAGHSLGEYSALVAAGAVDLPDALALVHKRGQLMQKAVPLGTGGMAAVLGMPLEEIKPVITAISKPGHVVEIANLNGGGQVILAGHLAALEEAKTALKARRFLPLPVSAPFHCSLMAPAANALAPMLDEMPVYEAEFPIITNVDVMPVIEPEDIRSALKRQVTSPVRWEETVLRMVNEEKISAFVEVGAGNVLSGLVKRIAPEAKVLTVNSHEAAKKAQAELAAISIPS